MKRRLPTLPPAKDDAARDAAGGAPDDATACCVGATAPEPLPARDRKRLTAVFRALGDPTRLEVFRLVVSRAEPSCVCEIVQRFHVGQPTVSHHLRVLREAGLVTVSRRGVWAYYAPDPAGIARASAAVAAVLPEGVSAES